jgi:hypothetical protein
VICVVRGTVKRVHDVVAHALALPTTDCARKCAHGLAASRCSSPIPSSSTGASVTDQDIGVTSESGEVPLH